MGFAALLDVPLEAIQTVKILFIDHSYVAPRQVQKLHGTLTFLCPPRRYNFAILPRYFHAPPPPLEQPDRFMTFLAIFSGGEMRK